MAGDNRFAVALNGYGLDHYELDGGYKEILPWVDLAAVARLAERVGYERIFVPEIRGREAFATLAGFAALTERIGLASGVVALDTRRLLATAMGATSLFEMSKGRFVLGVGSSARMSRTRDLIRGLRECIAGDDAYVPFADEEEDEGFATGQHDWYEDPPPVPIWLAALGPRMVGLAAEMADGVILNWCTPERVATARAAVGRRPEFTVAVYVRACLTGADGAETDALKTAAARYVSRPYYFPQFEAMGLGKEARAAKDAIQQDRYPPEALPDRLIEATCVWGERDSAVARLREYLDAGADLVVVYPVAVREARSSLEATIMALAPDPAVEH